MKEIWKPIKGFEEEYLISNLGNLKSLKGKNPKILKTYKEKHGYIKYVLTKRKKGVIIKYRSVRIHKLVAEHFIPNPNNYSEINHKDCNKENNKVDNLEWCTKSQNTIHAIKNNLGVLKGVNKFNKNKCFKKYGYIYQYDKNNNYINKFKSAKVAQEKTGICARNILQCINNEPKRKSAGGYIWKAQKLKGGD